MSGAGIAPLAHVGVGNVREMDARWK